MTTAQVRDRRYIAEIDYLRRGFPLDMPNRCRYPEQNSCFNFPLGSFAIEPISLKELIKALRVVRPGAECAPQPFANRKSRICWLNENRYTLAVR